MAKIENFECAKILLHSNLKDVISNLTESGLLMSLVVDADNQLLGVVGDGDVRRGLLAGLTLSSPTESVMNRDFRSAIFDESDEALRRKCDALGVTALPLTDSEGKLRGLFKRDIAPQPIHRSNKIVLMAGGLGTRLGSLTRFTPKPMVSVAGKPMIQHLIEAIRDEGFADFTISVNYRAEQIEEHFGNGESLGVSIKYLREEKPSGTAGSLSLLPRDLTEPVIVINADVFFSSKVVSLLEQHELHDPHLTVGVKLVESRSPYGVVETDGHRVIEILEKPVRSDFVVAGIYVLEPRALSRIRQGQYLDMPDLISELIKFGRVSAYPIHESWLDLGTPENLSEAEEMIMSDADQPEKLQNFDEKNE